MVTLFNLNGYFSVYDFIKGFDILTLNFTYNLGLYITIASL